MVTSPDGFAELHCKSNFSFLEGASHPEELVARAAELGYRGLAITDECSLAGVVKAHLEAKKHALRLVIGSEFSLSEGIKLVPDHIPGHVVHRTGPANDVRPSGQ